MLNYLLINSPWFPKDMRARGRDGGRRGGGGPFGGGEIATF